MENQTLATEILHEFKSEAKAWRKAFLVTLITSFITILLIVFAFLWYISLPVEEVSNTQEINGDATTQTQMMEK